MACLCPLTLEQSLSSPVAVPVAASVADAERGAGGLAARVRPGGTLTAFVGVPPVTAWPKGVAAGDVLTGEGTTLAC